MASYSARQPMSPAQLINQARQAIKQGQRQEAQRLLNEAARLEPDNEMIWLWLASVAPSPQLSLEYVQRAEAINPTNPRVAEARRWAERRLREMQIPNLPTPETAAHTPHKKKGKTAVIWATLFIILFLIVGVISLFLWNQLQSPTAVRAQLPDAQQAAILPEQLPVNKAPKAAEHTATPKPLVPAKQIGDNTTDDPRPTWTITPTPTPTFTPTPTWVPTFVSSRGQTYSTRPHGVGADEKWIDVNISTQTLRAYIGNDMVFSTLISSGTAEFPTVTGQFRIWLSYESQTMDGRLLGYDYYLENVPYVMYFYNDYALHGTFWHNNFGNPMSHGCVNLKTGDAGWIYSWASIGTLVNVHK